MKKCRRCKKEVTKTIFGYCDKCAIELGAKPTLSSLADKIEERFKLALPTATDKEKAIIASLVARCYYETKKIKEKRQCLILSIKPEQKDTI